MRHPDIWAAAASHSGDAGFELLYMAGFPTVLRALAKHGNSIEAWMKDFEAKLKLDSKDTETLMYLCQAASFDPDPEAFLGLRLPVSLDTCEVIAERWNNWLAWDPARMVTTHADAIGKLKGFFLDCGTEDQFSILYGTRRIHRTLEEHGIAHRYEEFPDDHTRVDYRMDVSLPYLANVLST